MKSWHKHPSIKTRRATAIRIIKLSAEPEITDAAIIIFKIVQTTLILISFLLIGVIVWVFHRFERRRSSDMQLINATNDNLQQALKEVKTLRGILPICGHCKKIRDEKGIWNQLETYIHNHSDAEFSHGICSDCYRKQIEKLEEDD